jgi:hypothetical protein
MSIRLSSSEEEQPDKTTSSNITYVKNTGGAYQYQAIALIKLCWHLSRLSQQQRLQHMALRT